MVRLSRPHAVEGVVRGVDGEALPFVPVVLRLDLPEDGDPQSRLFQCGEQEWRRTDHEGRFRFTDLSPGKYGLTCTPEGYPRLAADVEVEARGNPEPVVLRPAASGSLRVRVTDEDGRPVPGVPAQLMTPGNPGPVVTDAEGRASWQGLPDPPPARSPIGFPRLTVGRGDRADLPHLLPFTATDLELDGEEIHAVLRRGALVSGKVVAPDGRPLVGLALKVRGEPDLEEWTYTDWRGEFRFVAAPGAELDIRLADTRFLDDRGVPITDSESQASPWRGELTGVIAPSHGLVLRAHREE
jgi:hypothetical protein